MKSGNDSTRFAAIQQFKLARRRAKMRDLMSRLKGRKDELLLFDEVRQALDLAHPKKEELKEIPLDSIVGTVSRYYDFNRQFNPMQDSDQERWSRVKELMEAHGLDPIEVYQVDDLYFVLDGNHRVSVSRHFGSKTIEAYVKEFRTNVDLDPDDDLEDVVLKAEWNELMADTLLDSVRPEVEIRVTVPGRYKEIQEHIAVHRHYLGLEREEEIPIEEASASWVDHIYLPAVKEIRKQKLLDDFPGRTETDLYLWLKKHQWELQNEWDQSVTESTAAADLIAQFGERFWHRLWTKLTKKTGEDQEEKK